MRINLPDPVGFAEVFRKTIGIPFDTEVTGITTDSREVQSGDLYVAIDGERVDGHRFLKEVNDFGVSRLIYTDINKDGTKSSPNFKETEQIAEISNCPVIISGGVSSIDDVKKAKNLNNKKIEGIIVGKAIYDGDIQLDELAKEIDA